MEINELWKKVLKILKSETSDITFKTYIKVISPKCIEKDIRKLHTVSIKTNTL